MLDYYAASIPGSHKAEAENEDAVECKLYEDGCLVVAMADGITSSGEGRRAATEVVRLVHKAYESGVQGGARSLLNAFEKNLHEGAEALSEGFAQTTLTVVCFRPSKTDGVLQASFLGIGDTAILLAQDTPVSQDYPGTFLCYRLFGAPQPSMDSRVYAYVDLGCGAVVGRPLLGEFEIFHGDICLIHTDGIRDEYIRKTTNREHRFLLDVKRQGARRAVEGLLERVRSDVGDDATIAAVWFSLCDVNSQLHNPLLTGSEESEREAESVNENTREAVAEATNSAVQRLVVKKRTKTNKNSPLGKKGSPWRRGRPSTRRR